MFTFADMSCLGSHGERIPSSQILGEVEKEAVPGIMMDTSPSSFPYSSLALLQAQLKEC